MATKVIKYSLTIAENQIIHLPIGSEILTIQNQFGGIVLFALIDDSLELEDRNIETIGRGNDMPSMPIGLERKYISTYQENGGFTFHAFEIRKK